jgi:hypothetical protein
MLAILYLLSFRICGTQFDCAAVLGSRVAAHVITCRSTHWPEAPALGQVHLQTGHDVLIWNVEDRRRCSSTQIITLSTSCWGAYFLLRRRRYQVSQHVLSSTRPACHLTLSVAGQKSAPEQINGYIPRFFPDPNLNARLVHQAAAFWSHTPFPWNPCCNPLSCVLSVCKVPLGSFYRNGLQHGRPELPR